MRSFLRLGLMLSLLLCLANCSTCPRVHPDRSLVNSTWRYQVDTDSRCGLRGASPWFVKGQDQVKPLLQRAPSRITMGKVEVRVPNSLTHLQVNGRFKIELVETDDHSSLVMYGPYAALHAISVQVTPRTLCISELKDAPANMSCVIIRINIRNLQGLIQEGPGQIEGYLMRHHCLEITSTGCGAIYLTGPAYLTHVTNKGGGNITALNVMTSSLTIETQGKGNVNVGGRVGIQNITHHGAGNINIIGANTYGLSIDADGQGKIGLYGRWIVIDEINARDNVRVYAYSVHGRALNIYVADHAAVGLAGNIQTLYVETNQSGSFEGRYLYADNAFLQAHGRSHINARASKQLFASATDNSSIYYFSSPPIITKTAKQNAVILSPR